mmetsp:Transcript_15826/g.34623  ORF Transcript_15826/g.34623 Transcript_15826/m.34623 type:complete len:410 (+) Transcript_15826:121-1350(+)
MGSNCVASASIGCLFCCQGCNAEKLRNAFTFLPPPRSYTFQETQMVGNDGDGLVLAGGRLVYVSEILKNVCYYHQAADHAEVRILRTSRGERIPVVWMRRSNASSASSPPPKSSVQDAPLVLLHCHGNATDIGMMMGPYFELTKQLGIEVVGVEYTGYGISSGTPSARHCCSDVEAAYDYLVASGVQPDRIVVYGQSVGSGPAVSLASKKQVGGVILHSPMLSGIKVIDPSPEQCCRPSCVYHCFDFFPNDQRVKKVNCPVFVIHGMNDDIIPFHHGARLSEASPKNSQWPGYFPDRAGHNDIVEQNPQAYFAKIGGFLRWVAQRSTSALHSSVQVPSSVAANRKPAQVTMVDPSEMEPVLKESEAPGFRQYQEPVVGPEDGRYEKLRHGQGQGGARELLPSTTLGLRS